jgi:hypothetical protein
MIFTASYVYDLFRSEYCLFFTRRNLFRIVYQNYLSAEYRLVVSPAVVLRLVIPNLRNVCVCVCVRVGTNRYYNVNVPIACKTCSP